MTMQHESHPDDERLAAFAGGDHDAVADPSLSAHISSCNRCGPMVDELAGLRTALAELPDLAPSRPLRLIPPVPAAPAPRPTSLGWLRRLAGPAMAAGAGLVLIGAIGVGATSGIGTFFSRSAGALFQNVGDNLQGGAPEVAATPTDNSVVPGAYGASTPPGSTKGVTDSGRDSEPPSPRTAQASPTPVPAGSGGNDQLGGQPSQGQPWLALLIAGVALFGTSAALRFSISPRAG